MGSKVNPQSIRLKINKTWNSRWFGKQSYVDSFINDLKIKKLLKIKLKEAAVSEIIIKRDANKVAVNIFSGRPGVIIGRGGSGVEDLKKILEKETGSRVQVNIVPVKKPDIDAGIIAQNIAFQIEKRIPFKRAVKQTLDKAKTAGVKGIKIQVAGRLNGIDIARRETFNYGTVPLSTFSSDIDYRNVTALTTYGIIGVKVWVYNGERTLTEEDLVA